MDYIWLVPLAAVLMGGGIALTVLLTIRRNFRRMLETVARNTAQDTRRVVFVGGGGASGSQPPSWSDAEWTTTYIGPVGHGHGPVHDHGGYGSSDHGSWSSCSSDSGSSSSSSSDSGSSSSSSSSSDSGSSSC